MKHADIVNLWPSAADLARDIGADKEAVRKWRQRGSIPARYHRAVLAAAEKRAQQAKTKRQAAAFRKLSPAALMQ